MMFLIALSTSCRPISLPMAGVNDHEEIIWLISDASPTHYTVKIESFSLLAKHAIERYETASFEAEGYKWKLVLCPNGNKSKSVKDHFSVYLALADSSSLLPGWEVHTVFRLYLLDQNKDSYLCLQGNERRFHSLKHEWGFDEFIPIQTFSDASNGYLVADTCVFGADVFVSKERSTGRGEHLRMIQDAASSRRRMWLRNVFNLDNEFYYSVAFFSGGKKWKIKLYPKGTHEGTGSHLSVYLVLVDPECLPVGTKILAEITVRMFSELKDKDLAGKATYWFSQSSPEWGWAKFVSLAYMKEPSSGLALDGYCGVEADVCVHGIVSAL